MLTLRSIPALAAEATDTELSLLLPVHLMQLWWRLDTLTTTSTPRLSLLDMITDMPTLPALLRM
jgi:hypothetical protein